jgi:Ca-activated chloride channel family protein
MPYLLKYAKNSARKFGGLAGGYLRIHEWFDEPKAVMADFRHRALRHHAEAIFMGGRIFRRLVTARATPAKARYAVMARRYSFCLRVVAVVVCALVVTTVFSQSQGPIQPPKQFDNPQKKLDEGIKVDVSLALVNVSVTDPLNRLVTGLDKDNFRVFEDGVEQEVVSMSSEDVPISIGVIFDMSGSMSDKVERAREAAVQFMRTANPLDQFFLVSFNDRAELISGFTSSVEELQNRMMFTASRGRTALLDAVYLGLSQMRGAQNAKRALLIISDGGDNHSRYNENDVKNFLKEADCQLYAIGIFDPIDVRSRTSEELTGPSLLSEMTEMTGGRAFPVGNTNELPDIAAKIGMELRNQYVLGYKPSNAQHNGTWRKIKVKMRPPKGLPPLTVYAKTGYFAPTQ